MRAFSLKTAATKNDAVIVNQNSKVVSQNGLLEVTIKSAVSRGQLSSDPFHIQVVIVKMKIMIIAALKGFKMLIQLKK